MQYESQVKKNSEDRVSGKCSESRARIKFAPVALFITDIHISFDDKTSAVPERSLKFIFVSDRMKQ